MSTEISVPIAPGELIDKLTILEIKSANIKDAGKLANVRIELELLERTWRESGFADADIRAQWDGLREVNRQLWQIEDDIRDKERAGEFDARFIELARSVYITNDRRAALKKEINVKLGSKIVEEKSYAAY